MPFHRWYKWLERKFSELREAFKKQSADRNEDEIREADPEFHAELMVLIDGPGAEERIRSAEAILRALFVE